MQNQTSPLILSFGVFDPVGAIGIQADLAVFAAMGCHGLSVATALLVGDTLHIEKTLPVEAETIAEQSRFLLEDMAIAAFKVGHVSSVENVVAIAEVISDYPDIPMVLDPFSPTLSAQDPDSDDVRRALYDMLLPQATVLQISMVELERLSEFWREPDEEDLSLLDASHLTDLGCQYILVTGTPCRIQEVANTLYSEAGELRHDAWPRQPGAFSGAGTTLSAALTGVLANGGNVPDAVLEAQEFTMAALAQAQRLGMGKRIPDRYFWTRAPDEPSPIP